MYIIGQYLTCNVSIEPCNNKINSKNALLDKHTTYTKTLDYEFFLYIFLLILHFQRTKINYSVKYGH